MTKPEQTHSQLPMPVRSARLQLRAYERRFVLILGDFFAIIASILLALALWAYVGERQYNGDFLLSQMGWFLFLPALWFVLASANDFYSLTITDRTLALRRLIIITLQMLVIYLIVFFFSDRDALPRLFIIYYGIFSFVLIGLWRNRAGMLLNWATDPRRVLIVGMGQATKTMIETIEQDAPQAYHIHGIISDDMEQNNGGAVQIVGTSADLLDCIAVNNIREVIITETQDLSDEQIQAIMDAYERGIAITPMPIIYERITGRVPVEHVGDSWATVLPMTGVSVFNPYPAFKRLLDVLLALLGLLVFVFLLPFLALLIYTDSPGSIFFRQKRIGRYGKPFEIIKLRTMIPDAERKTGAVFARANDPRITRIGRFLRKTRLDELPQLLNILRGDMSLIGPRPERPEHVLRLQEKIPFYRVRHTVRPGLTGWAQVRYKYGATDEDALVKLQYDLYYIRHQSPLLDVDILLRTVGKVLRMSGQ